MNTNRLAVFCLILWFVAPFLHVEAHAQNRPLKQYTIEDLMDTTQVRGWSFSPDGTKLLVSSNETGILNAFALPVDGNDPIQLTNSTTESILVASYFPHDERFIYMADRGGDERNHVYVRDLDGTVTDLTPIDGVKAAFHSWAKDYKSFFISSNERDPKYFDLYEVALSDFEKKLIFENTEGYTIADVSADRRLVALQKVETRANSHGFIYDRESGTTEMLVEHQGDAVCRPQHFTRDGTTVRCLTDQGHEYLYLVAEGINNDETDVLERIEWDVQYARQSKSGRYLTVGVNNDSRAEVRIHDTTTGGTVPLPDIDGMSIAAVLFSPDEKALALRVQSGRSPGDLFYWRLGSSRPPQRLTRLLSERVDPNDLVEPEVVRFASYDGTVVPGILYRPHQANEGNRVPAIVQVHGGPGGQTRATYNPMVQYLVNHGYAVYGINNRGSSGYGKTFYAMDDLKHGSADLDDCVASKQMLIDTGYVDPNRIGILGGSYGGYMVCAALAFRPDAFDVGVDIYGVTNWVRTLKSIPSWWEASRNALYKELGDPFTQEAYLRKISPLFHADNITKPMIVLQGSNDPRVLQVESDEMVETIRSNGVPVEYVVFPDEGHGFRKKKNQITAYKAILEFVDTHLAGK